MSPRPSTVSLGGGPFSGPAPRDLVALLATLFLTFALQFFEATAPLVALLRLTPAVWQAGFVWQLATYPFVGAGGPSVWFLVALLFLYWFARDVRLLLGARRFWKLMMTSAPLAAGVALAVRIGVGDVAGALRGEPFAMMQGQWILSALVMAAFALLFRDRTILLFFVLPIRAAWFLPLELVLAFIAFLGNRDFAALAGIFAGVGLVAGSLGTGPGLTRRELRLRLEKWWLERRMARLRRKRGFRVVGGARDRNVN
ncbi:MAG: hypothetical protein ACREI7_02260, partial [Myxococcota bacterium]